MMNRQLPTLKIVSSIPDMDEMLYELDADDELFEKNIQYLERLIEERIIISYKVIQKEIRHSENVSPYLITHFEIALHNGVLDFDEYEMPNLWYLSYNEAYSLLNEILSNRINHENLLKKRKDFFLLTDTFLQKLKCLDILKQHSVIGFDDLNPEDIFYYVSNDKGPFYIPYNFLLSIMEYSIEDVKFQLYELQSSKMYLIETEKLLNKTGYIGELSVQGSDFFGCAKNLPSRSKINIDIDHKVYVKFENSKVFKFSGENLKSVLKLLIGALHNDSGLKEIENEYYRLFKEEDRIRKINTFLNL